MEEKTTINKDSVINHLARSIIFALFAFITPVHAQVDPDFDYGSYWQEMLDSDPAELYRQLAFREKEVASYPPHVQYAFWIRYCESALRLSKSSEVMRIAESALSGQADNGLKVEILLCRARAHEIQTNYNSAGADIDDALELARSLVPPRPDVLVLALIEKAQFLVYSGDFPTAAELLQQAHDMAKEQGDLTLISAVNSAFGVFYSTIKDYQAALPFYQALLDEELRLDKTQQASVTSFNLATLYIKLEQYANGLNYAAKSRQLASQSSDEAGIAYANALVAFAHIELRQYDKGKVALAAVSDYFADSDDKNMVASVALYQAKLAQYEGDQEQAEQLYIRALQGFEQAGNGENQLVALLALSNLSENAGDVAKAFSYLNRHHDIEHELHGRLLQEQSLRLQMHFKLEQQETENKQLKVDLQYQQKELELQRSLARLLLAISVLVVMLLAVGALFFYRQRQYNRRMKRLANTDDLTGVANRRAVVKYLKRQYKLANRMERPLSVALMDIDEFKQINDNYGHGVGDKVLQYFATSIKSNIRSTDSFGRVGGEEFLWIMPDTTLPQAEEALAKLMAHFQAHRFRQRKINIPLLFSAGLTLAKRPDDTTEAILRRCDLALYEAKNSGRNQFRVGS